jgi:nucleotide-binding universal stress UspA family protein
MLGHEKPEKIVLFHAVSYPAQLESYSGKMRPAMKKVREDLTEFGDEVLLKAKDKITEKYPGTPVETRLVWGDPRLEIVAEADQGRYDLLVIGSRGLSGIKSFFPGSVGSHVAQHVKCSVILVKE